MKPGQPVGKITSKKYLLLSLMVFCLTDSISHRQSYAQEVLPRYHLAQSLTNEQIGQLEKTAETFIKELVAGNFATARLQISPALQAQISSERLAQIWKEQLDSAGPLKRILKTRTVDSVNADLVLFRVEFEKITDDIVITFNDKKEIIGLDLPKTESIQAIAEKFAQSLGRGDSIAARGNLSAYLKAELLPQDIEGQWQNLLKTTGQYQKIVKSQVKLGSDVDDVNIVLVTIQFEKTTDDMVVIFDGSKRIVGVDFPDGN